MYINETFEIDDDTIAIMTVRNTQLEQFGKSVVIHARLGVFLVDQTSTQVMNRYLKKYWNGFVISRTIALRYKLRHHLPLVQGHNIYLPLAGTKCQSCDWIGLHHVAQFKQIGTRAQFTTVQGEVIELHYRGSNLHDEIHDGCLLSKHHVEMIKRDAETIGEISLNFHEDSVIKTFNDCTCLSHLALPKFNRNTNIFWKDYLTIAFDAIAQDDYEPDRKKSLKLKFQLFNKKRRWR